jgi:hypothetical protein
MLTLYIVKTHNKNKTLADLYVSMIGLWDVRVVVDNVAEINEDEKDTDWYTVFFDNEFPNPDLRDAMKVVMVSDPPYDVLIFMEKHLDDKVFQSPRMFRKHVKLQPNSFLPEPDQELRYERLLDGWVKQNDQVRN